MIEGIEVDRRAEDFQYPKPSLRMRLGALLAPAAVTYAEGIDESKYQYSATRRVDHAAALAGGVTFTVIRVSNCLTADPCFTQAWQDAVAAGMPVLVYANIQGYANGAAQAKFAMETAAPLIAACKHEVVILGDFEADGLTMSVAARQKLAMDFLNEIHLHHHDTGIYSNIKYWGEMYGNLKPPVWAWLFGAHWTSAAVGSFPPSWDLSRLIIWQYGVWNNYSWAKPVPGNQPDIDKDRWMWSGGSVTAFLNWEAPPPPPAPVALQPVAATFHMTSRKPASCMDGQNAAGKPMFHIYPKDSAPVAQRIFLEGDIQVLPVLVLGDSGAKMYPVYMRSPWQLYVHADDGELKS